MKTEGIDLDNKTERTRDERASTADGWMKTGRQSQQKIGERMKQGDKTTIERMVNGESIWKWDVPLAKITHFEANRSSATTTKPTTTAATTTKSEAKALPHRECRRGDNRNKNTMGR